MAHSDHSRRACLLQMEGKVVNVEAVGSSGGGGEVVSQVIVVWVGTNLGDPGTQFVSGSGELIVHASQAYGKVWHKSTFLKL